MSKNKSEKFIVYKTTNLVDGRIYIGVHKVKSSNMDDGYLGSGRSLRKDISLLGKDCFKRETVRVFDCIEDAYNLEREIVDADFIARKDTYNISLGGTGGHCGSQKRFSEELLKAMYADMERFGHFTEETRKRWLEEKAQGCTRI